MAKEIDKIIQSKTAPKSNNVLWDDGENLKINRNGKWESAGGGAPMINITYANLVELCNNSQLIAGTQYRITDFVTTTAQENTRSAGHQFDVIVTADNENTLNEVARACLHEGETYFSEAGANLAAWQIWYCLDNDAERFAWALGESNTSAYVLCEGDDIPDEVRNLIIKVNVIDDAFVQNDIKVLFKYDLADATEIYLAEDGYVYNEAERSIGRYSIQNGKGVIYRMIDEWNNDIPYDFKNIQFKRNLNFDDGLAQFSEDSVETWVYTFTGQSYHINNDEWSGMLDGSLESPFGHMSDENTSTFHDNIIGPYIMLYNGNDIYTECGLRYLNDNVFLGYWDKIGSANDEDMPYYYAYCCHSNSFGNNCYNNSFGNNCNYNSFGNGCYSISFGNYCSCNSFGNMCYDNSLDGSCGFNSFGSDCYSNNFGNSSSYNSLGDSCSSIKLNEDTNYKTIFRNSSGDVKVFNLGDLADLLNS